MQKSLRHNFLSSAFLVHILFFFHNSSGHSITSPITSPVISPNRPWTNEIPMDQENFHPAHAVPAIYSKTNPSHKMPLGKNSTSKNPNVLSMSKNVKSAQNYLNTLPTKSGGPNILPHNTLIYSHHPSKLPVPINSAHPCDPHATHTRRSSRILEKQAALKEQHELHNTDNYSKPSRHALNLGWYSIRDEIFHSESNFRYLSVEDFDIFKKIIDSIQVEFKNQKYDCNAICNEHVETQIYSDLYKESLSSNIIKSKYWKCYRLGFRI